MQAKVLVEHRDMLGNCYEVFEAVGNRITLVNKLFNPSIHLFQNYNFQNYILDS